MKVQVNKLCFLNNRRVYPGETVEVQGIEKLPDWMRKVEPDAPVKNPRTGRKPPATQPDEAGADDDAA